MLSEADFEHRATPVMLHVYVDDVDAVFERAVRASGSVVAPVTDQLYEP